MALKVLAAVTGFAILAATPAFANSACITELRLLHCKWLDKQTIIMEDIGQQKFKLTLKLCPAAYLRTRDRCALHVFGGPIESACARAGIDTVNDCTILSIVPYTREMEQTDKAGVIHQ